jgi:hypothetical protein
MFKEFVVYLKVLYLRYLQRLKKTANVSTRSVYLPTENTESKNHKC